MKYDKVNGKREEHSDSAVFDAPLKRRKVS